MRPPRVVLRGGGRNRNYPYDPSLQSDTIIDEKYFTKNLSQDKEFFYPMNEPPAFLEAVKKSVFIAVPLFGILVVVVLIAGCMGQTESQIIPYDKIVFLEHHTSENGITVNGSYCSPRLNIDFPMYFFDINSKKLTISQYREKYVNDSLILVYGDGKSVHGLAGSGAATAVFPVYSLPSSYEKNVTLDSIMADGTIFFRYNGQHLSLKSNETWENITHVVEKYGHPDSPGCTVEYITTDRFYNAGILDKRNIS